MHKKSLILFLLIPVFCKAQFQLKLKAVNTSDTICYFRAAIFDEKNYIPKDTFDIRKKINTYNSKKPIVGGIYYLYFPTSKQKVSFVLENKDSVLIEIEGINYLNSTRINNTKNNLFLNYQKLERSLAHYDSSYSNELKIGKKFNQVQKGTFFKTKTDSLVAFRKSALKILKSNEALSIYFKTLNDLDASIPSKRDFFLRDNFLNQFNFNDPKLFFTPAFKLILAEYAAYYPLVGDSLIKTLDSVMSKINCTNKAYPFVFDYYAKLYKNREIQNNTEVYSYFIKKYVKEGKCNFLIPSVKDAYLNELAQLQYQKIQDTCFNIILNDTLDQKQNLHEFAKKYNYTVIIFYDPNCAHCEIELPKLDSVINTLEQQLLVKIGKFAVCNAPSVSKVDWVRFVNKHNLNKDYIHVFLGNELPIRKAYDAFSNPLFYLIDKDGLLLAKKTSTNTLRRELTKAFQNFK